MNDFFDILIDRIKDRNVVEEKYYYNNEIRELLQEFVLISLAKDDFFENNVFMGGTALRLFHGLKRWSDDLDFNMKKDNKEFTWVNYFKNMKSRAEKCGFDLEILDERYTDNIKRIEIRSKNIGKIIHNKGIVPLNFTDKSAKGAVIKIENSLHSTNFNIEKKDLNLVERHIIDVMDINSLFAGKLNALITRRKKETGVIKNYVAERDVYDLDWYVMKGVEPNIKYLTSKLKEKEEYKDIVVDINYIKNKLYEKEKLINYKELNDVIKNITRKEDYEEYNKDKYNNIINDFGKGAFKIKCNNYDNSLREDDNGNVGKVLYSNSIKPMMCLKCDNFNNESIKDKITSAELVKIYKNDKSIDLSKYKYVNKKNTEIFVLERKTFDNKGIYKTEVWHFNIDFNKESAENFLMQYDNWKKSTTIKETINKNVNIKKINGGRE
jgi:predicted nucleotidyltransferase component of viral defense system